MGYSISASRWYAKKAARRGMALGAWMSGSLAARPGLAARVRVLTYHRFGESVYDPFCVGPRAFAAQMCWLARRNLAISLADLEGYLAGRQDLRHGAVLVTVDDGFRSVLTHMLPVLVEYNIPAVAYVSPGLLGSSAVESREGNGRGEAEPYLTWDELERLAARGVTIGSHGWSHRSLGRMEAAEARDEAFRSREALQSRLGSPVRSLAYPYGTLADFSPTTSAILSEAGYSTAFTSQHGAVTRSTDPIALPRVKVEGGEGLWMFRLICRGATDAWRWVDRALWRVQCAGRN